MALPSGAVVPRKTGTAGSTVTFTRTPLGGIPPTPAKFPGSLDVAAGDPSRGGISFRRFRFRPRSDATLPVTEWNRLGYHVFRRTETPSLSDVTKRTNEGGYGVVIPAATAEEALEHFGLRILALEAAWIPRDNSAEVRLLATEFEVVDPVKAAQVSTLASRLPHGLMVSVIRDSEIPSESVGLPRSNLDRLEEFPADGRFTIPAGCSRGHRLGNICCMFASTCFGWKGFARSTGRRAALDKGERPGNEAGRTHRRESEASRPPRHGGHSAAMSQRSPPSVKLLPASRSDRFFIQEPLHAIPLLDP